MRPRPTKAILSGCTDSMVAAERESGSLGGEETRYELLAIRRGAPRMVDALVLDPAMGDPHGDLLKDRGRRG